MPNRSIDAGDVVLNVEELAPGRAPALVLLHGFGDTLEVWRAAVGNMRAGHRVVAFDLRGHGDSTWPAGGDYSLDATVRDLAAVVGALGGDRPIVGGHSTGGMTALAHAGSFADRVAGLLLLDVDPFTFKDGLERLLAWRGPETAATPDELAERLRVAGDRRDPDRIRAWLAPRVRRTAAGTWTWRQDPRLRPARAIRPATARSEAAVREMLAAIRAPVLLLRGAESRACSAGALAACAAALVDAPCRTIAIPRAGHDLLGDAPEQVASEIDRFVAEA